MVNTKLYQTIFVLKKEEWKSLEKWISAHFAQENENIMRFFHLLCVLKEDWQSKKWEKEAIFKKLFPKEAYNYAKMRKMMFVLLRAIEQFICYRASCEPIQYETHLAEFYRERYVSNRFKEKVEDLEKQIKGIPNKNANFYTQKAILAKYRSYIQTRENFKLVNPLLLEQLYYEQVAFFIAQLQLYFSILWNNTYKQSDIPLNQLYSILHTIETDARFGEIPILKIYVYAVQVYISADKKYLYFDLLRKEILANPLFLSIEERTSIAIVLRNFANQEALNGVIHYNEIRFQLFLEHAKLGLIYSNNCIPSATFRAIVSLGLGLKRYKEVAEFIQNYQHKLPIHNSISTLNYCFAKQAFEEKKYSEVLKYLLDIETFTDINWEISNRFLRIKSFYHLAEIETAISHISALKVYVSRHPTLNEDKRENIRTFANFALRICNLPQKEESIEKLQSELANSICTEMEWLLSILSKESSS